jgi:hypothetical protein
MGRGEGIPVAARELLLIEPANSISNIFLFDSGRA